MYTNKYGGTVSAEEEKGEEEEEEEEKEREEGGKKGRRKISYSQQCFPLEESLFCVVSISGQTKKLLLQMFKKQNYN